MKKNNLILGVSLLFAMLFSPSVYAQTVTIGSQVWTTKNLDVATYRNGDVIPQVEDAEAWANLTTGAWCYYANDASNGTKYGKLYNWYAVSDPRGLAPKGFHIPSDAEWTVLTDYLGGGTAENNHAAATGTKMKSSTGWDSNGGGGGYSGSAVPGGGGGNGSNSSGFAGFPGGVVKQIDEITSQEIKISAEDLISGIYFYQVTQNGNVVSTGKMMINK